jgi:hypothetical protein
MGKFDPLPLKGDSFRFCVDLKQVNKRRTEINSYLVHTSLHYGYTKMLEQFMEMKVFGQAYRKIL